MTTSPLTTDEATHDPIVRRMLGGDVEAFFRDTWQRALLHVPAADPGRLMAYGVDDFLADLVATHPAPYGAVRVRGGGRFETWHPTTDHLRGALAEGAVCAIKLSREWLRALPGAWPAFRSLYGRLCAAVAMVYMSPDRSEDVDLFVAGPRSCLGTHFDRTEVFTLQLSGERRWIVEEQVSLDGILDVGRDPNWYPEQEIDFQGPTREIVLRPGDALYVPAYAIHRVTGVSWSVSLSLGLRAFNEIDYVEHLLDTLRMNRYMRYAPVASAPESLEERNAEAKLELLQRVRSLLGELEGLALGSLLHPVQLPGAEPGLGPGAGGPGLGPRGPGRP